MRRRRRDLRVGIRVSQAERRVDRIVVGVDQVVGRAGVLRVLRIDLLDERRGAHVDRKVAAAVAGAEDRERVERRDFIVGRILVVHPLHRIGVGEIARQLFAGAEQFLNRAEPVFLLFGRRLGAARVGGRRELGERRLREIRDVRCHTA
jgi:hypothetical protein